MSGSDAEMALRWCQGKTPLNSFQAPLTPFIDSRYGFDGLLCEFPTRPYLRWFAQNSANRTRRAAWSRADAVRFVLDYEPTDEWGNWIQQHQESIEEEFGSRGKARLLFGAARAARFFEVPMSALLFGTTRPSKQRIVILWSNPALRIDWALVRLKQRCKNLA